jgi:excisionase family DNA binding protein
MSKNRAGAPAAHPEQLVRSHNKLPRLHVSEPAQRLAYSIREAAALTGLSRSTIYVLLGQKKLLSLRVGGRRLIPHDALVALLDQGAV